MKKIYSKFTNNRKREFQIETSIYQDGDKRRAVKRAMNADAEAHIRKIVEYYEGSNCKLLCESRMLDDKTVEFEFVKGQTLTDVLLKAIRDVNLEELEKVISEYKSIICEVLGDAEDYEVILKSKVDAANVDLIFDNIIENEDGYKIIDYEWIIDDVDVDFIVYRAVYALAIKYGSAINKLMDIDKFYRMFGINPDDLENYKQKNQLLMEYICGKETYNDILTEYEKSMINVGKDMTGSDNCVKIYYKREEIYSDSDSDVISVYKERQRICYHVDNLSGVSELRIDPLDSACMCEGVELTATKGNEIYKIEEYTTNGVKVSDGKYVFVAEDPQIIIPYEQFEGADDVKIDFVLITNTNDIIRNVNDALNIKEAEKMQLILKNQECIHDKEIFKEMSRQLQKRLNHTLAENKAMKVRGMQ